MVKRIVQKEQDGASLSEYLTELLAEIRPGKLKAFIKSGGVRINGVCIKKDCPLEAGDVLELDPPDEYASLLPICEVEYEDENLLIFNKQPGFSCAADKIPGRPAMYHVAEKYMRKTGEFSISALSVPYICHELDYNTGGLLLIAKNQLFYEYILQALRQRRIRRFYRAIVSGRPRQDFAELRGFLERDAKGSRVRVLDQGTRTCKPIMTRYQVLRTDGELSVVDIEAVTALAHQVRAHMAHAGMPILGDGKYGDRRLNRELGVRYQALWEYRLEFETGVNNPLEYLTGQRFETADMGLPYCGLEECRI